MSKVQMLRALVKQRLTAAAEDIFGLFERTIAEYEETLCRSKEENERQRRLLDAVFNPQLRLHRAEVQQLSVNKEEVHPEEQQEWSSSLDQEDPEPPHIKEEQEELGTSQEGEHLQGPEEVKKAHLQSHLKNHTGEKSYSCSQSDSLLSHMREKPFNCDVCHKSFTWSHLFKRHKCDGESTRQSEQMETEGDGEDRGEPEPDRKSHPGTHLTPEDETEERSESETDVSDGDWRETREPQSGLNFVSNMTFTAADRQLLLHSCSECGKMFGNKPNLNVHMRIHTGEKQFICLVCGKIFERGEGLRQHMAVHSVKRDSPGTDSPKNLRLKTLMIVGGRKRTNQV